MSDAVSRGASLRAAARRQGRLVLAHHAPTAASTPTALDALVDALAARHAADGRRSCWCPPARSPPGSRRSGCRAARATSPPSRPRPASARGCSSARYTAAFARHGLHRRPGAADRRRRHPPRALPQRPAHARPAARPRRRADRQRERHGGHRRDPVRRQRPARRARRPPRRTPTLLVLLSDVDGLYDGDPRRPGATLVAEVRGAADLGRRRGRRRRARPGVGTRRHGHQGRGGPDRHRRRHPGRAHRGRAGRRRRWPATTSAPSSTRPATRAGTRLLWLAHATTPRGRLRLDAGRGARRSSSGGSSLLPGRHHRRRRASSRPATRSTWSTRTGTSVARGLVDYDADGAARRCSAARPATWPRARARRTSARSSTATTSS